MNDFFLASDRSILLELNHNKVTVSQLKMHNFDKWSGPAQSIKEFLKNHPDDIAKLLQDKTDDALAFVSLSMDRDAKDIERIMFQERGRSFEIVHTAIKINDAFFSEPDPRHDDSVDPRKKSSWFDAFQLLISNGHSNTEIMQMTYGAFRQYLKAAQKTEKQKIRNNAVAVRTAQHAAKKAFEEFMKNLEKDKQHIKVVRY